MCNTWGLSSINNTSFNQCYKDNLTFPKEVRDNIVTFMRVHNLAFNVLGYIPGVSFFSGIVRMISGAIILTGTLVFGRRSAEEGMIIGHWYDEALLTGVAQIGRGAIEAFVPYGWAINLVLDGLGTLINIGYSIATGISITIEEDAIECGSDMAQGAIRDIPPRRMPHPEPTYFPLLWPLYLV